MVAGATLIAPETVFLSFDTKIGRDVLIEPHVVFGPGCSIADGAMIHAFSHLERRAVAAARRRPVCAAAPRRGHRRRTPRSAISSRSRRRRSRPGAKVNHLSYIGDARVGAGPISAPEPSPAITTASRKHKTDIGAGAFIGSNSALVAPVTIGDGAYVGSGSVITKPFEPMRSRVARGRQETKAGWAKAFRDRHKKK